MAAKISAKERSRKRSRKICKTSETSDDDLSTIPDEELGGVVAPADSTPSHDPSKDPRCIQSSAAKFTQKTQVLGSPLLRVIYGMIGYLVSGGGGALLILADHGCIEERFHAFRKLASLGNILIGASDESHLQSNTVLPLSQSLSPQPVSQPFRLDALEVVGYSPLESVYGKYLTYQDAFEKSKSDPTFSTALSRVALALGEVESRAGAIYRLCDKGLKAEFSLLVADSCEEEAKVVQCLCELFHASIIVTLRYLINGALGGRGIGGFIHFFPQTSTSRRIFSCPDMIKPSVPPSSLDSRSSAKKKLEWQVWVAPRKRD